MPKDYYPDMDSEMPMGQRESEEPQQEETETESEGQTALIPKSMLQGKDFKVGDEIVLKITHDYEDEVAVEYATEEPKAGPELPGREEFDEADKGEEAYA